MTVAQPDPMPGRRAPISGVIALVMGIAALLFWWVPFLGVGLGAGSIVLGILAIRGGRARGSGIGGLALGSIAAIPAVVVTIVFLSAFVIALPVGSGSGEPSVSASPGATAAPNPSPTPTPSPSTGAEEKAQYEARLKAKQEAERAAREEDARKNGVELPDLTGLDGKTAQWRLADLGLVVEFDGKSGSVFVPANWTVIGSSPAAGERAMFGGTVVLRVEKTAEMRAAPTPSPVPTEE